MTELIDPDCRQAKHGSCVGGPRECACHTDTVDHGAVAHAFLYASLASLFACGGFAATGDATATLAAGIAAAVLGWLAGEERDYAREAARLAADR